MFDLFNVIILSDILTDYDPLFIKPQALQMFE